MAAPAKKVSLDELNQLEEEYRNLCTADDDDARNRCRDITKIIRSLGPHVRCGDEPMLQVDIPKGPDGLPVRINGKPYEGLMVLHQCTWRAIEKILDVARRQDMERFRDAGVIYDLSKGKPIIVPKDAPL